MDTKIIEDLRAAVMVAYPDTPVPGHENIPNQKRGPLLDALRAEEFWNVRAPQMQEELMILRNVEGICRAVVARSDGSVRTPARPAHGYRCPARQAYGGTMMGHELESIRKTAADDFSLFPAITVRRLIVEIDRLRNVCEAHGLALQRAATAAGLLAGADVHRDLAPAITALRDLEDYAIVLAYRFMGLMAGDELTARLATVDAARAA